jgi:hypothetical protein
MEKAARYHGGQLVKVMCVRVCMYVAGWVVLRDARDLGPNED